MAQLPKSVWQILNTDIRYLVQREQLQAGTDAVIQAPESLNQLSENITAVQKALGEFLPEAAQWFEGIDKVLLEVGEALPVVSVGAKLFKVVLKLTQEDPTLASSVAMVAQLAYGEALKQELYRIQDPNLKSQLQGLRLKRLWQIQEIELEGLTDQEVKAANQSLRNSKVGERLTVGFQKYLEELGVGKALGSQWADRVLWVAQPLWLETVATLGETVQPLAEVYRLGGQETWERYQSLERYLEEEISKKPQEKVFSEDFTFQDVYVPLLAQPLRSNGEPDRGAQPCHLEEWVLSALEDEKQKNQVLFIQGGPGRGKSVFCRMMADRLRREEYPRWVPVLIRLRDLTILEKDFEETLRKGVDRDFSKSDAGWLTDTNIRYVFLLDGFDELLMEGRTSGGLEEFLGQVGKFQESCARNSEKQHRVVITGRTMALQNIERRMPDNLQRVQIEPLSDKQVGQWFKQWGRILKQEPEQLLEIWKDQRLPEVVRELTREPLLLYLFAAMHRDGELAPKMFEGADAAAAKVLIYEKTLDWVLTRQRVGNLNQKLTELETDNLRRILQEAGLAVLQSGRECASLAMIQERLKRDEAAKAFLEAAQRRLGEDPLKNALAVFYLKAGPAEGSVEFVHKSFSEFLCAERIVEALVEWAQLGGRKRQSFAVPDPEMHWEIYDLLAGKMLTVEVVEYLRVLWFRAMEDEGLIRLFSRLNDFYDRWCEGEFMDMAPGENLPQRKMMQLRDLELESGLRQVDVYTGLNVMILLLELHRYGQPHKTFSYYPSGQASEGHLTNRLWRIIAYADSLALGTFTNLSGAFLSGAYLSRADLSGAYLSRANLSGANLIRADLSGADLSGANLSSANLIGANLSSADLSSADLSGANLIRADLSGANLIGANLSSADLSGANLSGANLSGANLSGANPIGANLSGANLIRANLIRANLIRANLSSADLSSADLSSADLSSANLSSANLRGANLSSADLSSADLSRAVLSDLAWGEIRWDEQAQWEDVRGLESAIGVPEALKRQLGLSDEPQEAETEENEQEIAD